MRFRPGGRERKSRRPVTLSVGTQSAVGIWDELFDDDAMRASEAATALGVSLGKANRLARKGILEGGHREYSFGLIVFVDAKSVRGLQRDRRAIAKGFEPKQSYQQKYGRFRKKKRELTDA